MVPVAQERQHCLCAKLACLGISVADLAPLDPMSATELNITKEDLFKRLSEKNIGIQLHYIPINKQPYYKGLGYGNEETPLMDRYYEECFSLPIHPKMSDEE